MKLGVKKIAEGEFDIEKLIEKKMEYDFKNSNGKTSYQIRQEEKRKNKELKFNQDIQKVDKNPRKTRYQIRQEEKRKNKELEHRRKMKEIFVYVGMMIVIMIFIMIICILGETFL